MARKTEFNITQTSFKDAAEMFLELHNELYEKMNKHTGDSYDLFEKHRRLEKEYLYTIDRMIDTMLGGFNADIDKNGIFTIQSLYAATAKKLIDDIDEGSLDDLLVLGCYFHFLAGMHNVVKYLDKADETAGLAVATTAEEHN